MKMKNPKKVNSKKVPVLPRDEIAKLQAELQESKMQLLELKAQFDLTKEVGMLGIWVYDTERDEMTVDGGLKNVFGFSPDGLPDVFKNWGDYIHPDDLPGLQEAVKSIYKSEKEQFEYSHRLRQKNGAYRWVMARGKGLRDSKGWVKRVIGIDIDVSNYKIIEEDLKERVELEREIAQISSVFINVKPEYISRAIDDALTRIGKISHVDKSYMFLFSDDKKSISNTNEWLKPGTSTQKHKLQNIAATEFPSLLKKLKTLDHIYVEDTAKLPKNNREKNNWLSKDLKSLLIVPMSYNGELAGFIGFGTAGQIKKWLDEDIRMLHLAGEIIVNAMMRIKANQLILENQKRYKTLFDLSPSGIMVEDKNGNILDVNPPYCKSVGYTREELLGKNIAIFASPNSEGLIKNNLKYLLKGNELRQEVKSYRKDGSYCYMELFEKSITLHDDSKGILCVTNDVSERREAENALRESEERYRSLVDNIPSGIIVHIESKIVYANPSAKKLLCAKNTKDIIGKDIFDFVHPDDHKLIRDRIKKLKSGMALSNPVMEKFVCVNGQEFDAETTGIRIKYNDTPASLIVFNDISERKNIEDALRKSENHFRNLFENSPISLWEEDFSEIKSELVEIAKTTSKSLREEIFGETSLIKSILPKAKIVNVNDASLKLFDAKDKKELRSMQEATFLIETVHFLDEAIMALWEGRNHFRAETVAKTLKDVQIHLSINVFIAPGYQDSWERVIFAVTNISDLKRTEEALRQNERRFRNIFENALIGIYQTTPDGKILMANKALVKMLGFEDINDLLTRDILEDGFTHGFTRDDFMEIIERNGIVTGLENAWKKKNGEILFIRESARVVKDKDGDTLYYEGTVEDITERKQLEKLLQQAQKIEVVGQLAGGIAHDFNNLLTIISGHAELALMKISEDSAEYSDLHTIQTAAERAGKLTRKLLGFSRKQMLELQVLDLNEVIKEHLVMIRSLLGENIEIKSDFQAGFSSIHADPNQIEQLLLNLVLNARDAINDNSEHGKSKISIKTENMTIDDESLTQYPFNKTGSHIVLSVKDSGIGMSENVKQHIFEPFFSTKSKEKGTGLGLATVYGIVGQNNAGIYVQSEPGQGSTFRVVWPVYTEKQKQKPAKWKREIENLSGSGRFLFVEDEPGVRKFACSALRLAGYDVVEAENGVQALTIIDADKAGFDLIITDLIMPEMGGKELADLAIKRHPGLQILFTSGYSDDYALLNYSDSRAINFIYKPYSIEDLTKKIKNILKI